MINLRDFDWDDDLTNATRRDGKPRMRVYCPDRIAVVLGRGSRPDQEVKVDKVHGDGVPLLRRRGGGCAVVLDPGNVVVSCALSLPGLGRTTEAFSVISDWVINGLDQVGVPKVHQEGISDLALEDRKIGGACIYRAKDFLYYTTTLLFEPDLTLVERYLLHPPREPEYRRKRTHSAFMGSLENLIPECDIVSFTREINRILGSTVDNLLSEYRSVEGCFNPKSKTHEVMA